MIGNHSNDRFDEMYSTMIAGSVPSHSGDTEQSVLFLAKDILNVSSLHTIVKESKEHRRVFYFAVPSASLHSTIEPRTALVAAIPGHKDHRGDGIYSLPMGLMTAAAIFKEGDLRFVVNSTEVMAEYFEELDLPLYDVSETSPEPLVSEKSRQRSLANLVEKKAIRFSVLVSAFCLLALVCMSVIAGFTKKQAAAKLAVQERDLRSAVATLTVSSPLAAQLSRFQNLASFATTEGGWVAFYRLTQGGEDFKVYLRGDAEEAVVDKISPRATRVRDNEWLVVGPPTAGKRVDSTTKGRSDSAHALSAPLPPLPSVVANAPSASITQ